MKVISGVGFIFGAAYMVAGRLLLRYVVQLSCIVCSVCIGNACVYVIYDGQDSSTTIYWLFFFIFSIIGCLLAWLSTKYEKLGYL